MDWTKLTTSLNVFVYKVSNGRLGNKLGKQSVLVLFTTGRKSGKKYATSLSYYRDGAIYLVVASNWGKEIQPDWYLNLLHQPQAIIQAGTKRITVSARSADSEEFQRLWELVTAKNEQYISYQGKIKRRIPIVILTPLEAEK